MTVLDRISYYQNKRDEEANIVLAKELAETENLNGINEIVENLFNKDKKIQSDCLKVLYEIGYIKPELIENYVEEFFKLLKSKNNRMVWGAMIVLSTIASIKEREIYSGINTIYYAIENGSVITIDNGIKVLAKLAAKDENYSKNIFPYLVNHIKTCRLKEVAQHSESIFVAVNEENKKDFIEALEFRENDLTKPQLARVHKLYKRLG